MTEAAPGRKKMFPWERSLAPSRVPVARGRTLLPLALPQGALEPNLHLPPPREHQGLVTQEHSQLSQPQGLASQGETGTSTGLQPPAPSRPGRACYDRKQGTQQPSSCWVPARGGHGPFPSPKHKMSTSHLPTTPGFQP